MSSNARHRAPGRAITPLNDLNLGMGATAATVAVTAAGVAMSATSAGAATGHTATVSHSHRATHTASHMSHSQLIAAERTYTHYYRYHRHQFSSYRAYLMQSSHFGSSTQTRVSTARQQVLSIMRQYTGIYYRWGGTTPAGFDCSGFTQYVYRKVGINLPRTAEAQRYAGRMVSRSVGRPGDLVSMPGHIGIYLGNGMMFDSPRTGKAIGARKIWSNDYQLVRVIN